MPAYSSSAVATQTESSAWRQVSAAEGRVMLVMVSPFASEEAGCCRGYVAARTEMRAGLWAMDEGLSSHRSGGRPRTRHPAGKDRFLMRDRLGHTIRNA
ncbi:hypothetical protein ASF88_19720 [Leifsonia sp. Leaf336]|nr:hypothetical protein ASF88_19720 [Leifsonia sp. Leaf336]